LSFRSAAEESAFAFAGVFAVAFAVVVAFLVVIPEGDLLFALLLFLSLPSTHPEPQT
jgi:hypothetical protein